VKTPVTIAPEALDFTQLIRAGETIGWAEATAEPVFLTRLLDAQAERCPPFRVFFALTFSDGFAADHPNVTVTALGGASAGRRFFADRADNVMPANISDVSGLVSRGRLPIDLVLLQVSGPDETGRYNAGLGIEHLHAASQTVYARCAGCHSTVQGQNKIGPSLAGVVGRKSGTEDGYSYSPVMENANITWDDATLDKFLASPAGVVHGTKMFMSLPSSTDRQNVIAYLDTLK